MKSERYRVVSLEVMHNRAQQLDQKTWQVVSIALGSVQDTGGMAVYIALARLLDA